MDQKRYLLKMKGKLIFRLPAVSQREVLNKTEEFIREENGCAADFAGKKCSAYMKCEETIEKEKNFRLLASVFFLITAIICGISFLDMFQSGISSYTFLYVSAVGTALSFTFLLWIVSGVDCFWNGCYHFSRKLFFSEQLCFILIAAVEQIFVGFVIPQMCIQGTFTWNLNLYYCIWGTFFALTAAEIFLLTRGRWQSYFSLIQMIGIMMSLATFELRMNDIVDTPELLLIQPLILPYYSGLVLSIILYCYLNKKILKNVPME